MDGQGADQPQCVRQGASDCTTDTLKPQEAQDDAAGAPPRGAAQPKKAEATKPLALQNLGKTVPATLGLITLSGFWLALLGYGFTLGVGAAFGMPHAALSDSALDLVKFGSDALLQIFNSVYPLRALGGAVAKAYKETGLAIVLGVTALLALFPLRKLREKWSQRVSSPRRASSGSAFPRRILSLIALVVLHPILMLAALCLSIFAVVLITHIVPIFGYQAAIAHTQKYVIEPARCGRGPGREERLKQPKRATATAEPERGALCAAVVRNGARVSVGRLVLMTANYALLFDPVTGAVRRVSLSGADVELVWSL